MLFVVMSWGKNNLFSDHPYRHSLKYPWSGGGGIIAISFNYVQGLNFPH